MTTSRRAPQLRQFRSSRTSSGQPVLQFNPYFRYRGRARWPARSVHRRSDPVVRSQMGYSRGLAAGRIRARVLLEPIPARRRTHRAAVLVRPVPAAGAGSAQSRGVPVVGDNPGSVDTDGSLGPGSNPLRWESTAFNLDYQAAMVRFYYDNPSGARTSWGDATYAPCQPWRSIGGWYRPYPWGNADQASYIRKVRRDLADRRWTSASFEDGRHRPSRASSLCGAH